MYTCTRIYNCLLTTIAAVQAADARASFLFVCDLNGHHQEWLGSTNTNRHGVAVSILPLYQVVINCCPIQNFRRVLGVSLENYFFNREILILFF